MTDLALLATPLIRAATKARSLADGTIVIKLGGSAMEDANATAGTMDCIAALHQLGLKIVLVHGGGKPIDRAMAAANIEPRKIRGRRYTDQATLEIVVETLGTISSSLAEALEARQTPTLVMHDAELLPIGGELLMIDGEDLGFVGQPTSIDTDRIAGLLEQNIIPIIPSLALDDQQSWLNVNADTAACAVAGTLQAERAIFLTDTPGILKNMNDPASIIAWLTVEQCRKLIEIGTISGGMIPKVEACFEALEMGAERAMILDGRNPHALLSEFICDQVLGTEIVP